MCCRSISLPEQSRQAATAGCPAGDARSRIDMALRMCERTVAGRHQVSGADRLWLDRDESSFFDADNDVALTQHARAVRDHERGPPAREPIQCLQNGRYGFQIDGTGRLSENANGR